MPLLVRRLLPLLLFLFLKCPQQASGFVAMSSNVIVTSATAVSAEAATATALSNSVSAENGDTSRRERRWDAAISTLESTTNDRSRFDHRAHLARIIGVYVSDGHPHAHAHGDDSFNDDIYAGDDVGSESSSYGEGSYSEAEILVAMQPDQGGRKLLFLDAIDGTSLGFIELETQSSMTQNKIAQVDAATATDSATSALRGMLVTSSNRGRGYARLFLSIWLQLCLRAGVTPATTRINKPLLALTLVRLGFTPLRGRHLAVMKNVDHLRASLGRGGEAGDGGDNVDGLGGGNNDGGSARSNVNGWNAQYTPPKTKPKKKKKLKEKQRPLAVEVSVGIDNSVLLYSPVSVDRLRAGFSDTEVKSQRLVVVTEPTMPRGRVAHLRVRYSPPINTAKATAVAAVVSDSRNCQIVHAPLAEGVGGRLRLSRTQGRRRRIVGGGGGGGAQPPPSVEERVEALRLLTGLL